VDSVSCDQIMMRKISFLLCLLIVVACAHVSETRVVVSQTPIITGTPVSVSTKTPQATRTQRPTDIPSSTHLPTPIWTPVPPLTKHEWQPEAVLVKLESGGGDGCCEYSYPPKLVLYSDGSLFVVHDEEIAGAWRTQLFMKKLDRQETCSFLNAIDQSGFFDYDPSAYKPAHGDLYSVQGAASTRITINAWRQVTGEFYGLDYYADPYRPGFANLDYGDPVISPSLYGSYYLLDTYFPAGMEVYQPEKLGIFVRRKSAVNYAKNLAPTIAWPFTDLALDKIERQNAQNGTDRFVELDGSLAKAVYEFFGESIGEILASQKEIEYLIYARPLFPYEAAKFHDWNVLPADDVQPPSFIMSCYPDDGALPISTPTPSP
jgi:hypothetical protein